MVQLQRYMITPAEDVPPVETTEILVMDPETAEDVQDVIPASQTSPRADQPLSDDSKDQPAMECDEEIAEATTKPHPQHEEARVSDKEVADAE